MSTTAFSQGNRPNPQRVALELDHATSPGSPVPRWIDLTARHKPAPEIVRIAAGDLRAAQRTTARIHAEAIQRGRRHIDVAVLVDLDAIIAGQASAARAQVTRGDIRAAGAQHPETLRYVGTPSGLAGLITDIFRAEVADGVTVRPMSPETLTQFVETTLPLLQTHGVDVDAARGILERSRRPTQTMPTASTAPRHTGHTARIA
jgi:hypothetical protein